MFIEIFDHYVQLDLSKFTLRRFAFSPEGFFGSKLAKAEIKNIAHMSVGLS